MRLALPLLALGLLLAPVGAASAINGELVSDSPVSLFGGARVRGEVDVFHQAPRDGSLSGVSYKGRLLDHVRLDVPGSEDYACQEEYDGDEYDEILLTADVQDPSSRVDFELREGAAAQLEVRDELRFIFEAAGAPASPPEDSFAHVGPNPYVHLTGQRPAEGTVDPGFAPVFPAEPFLVLPAGRFHTDARHTMLVPWGTLAATQHGSPHDFAAGVREETRPIEGELPFGSPAQCEVLATHVLRFDQDLSLLAIDQDGLDRAQRYYDGEQPAGIEAGEAGAPPRGYWWRDDPDGAQQALRDAALPATTITATGLALTLDGSARFERAVGGLLFDGKLREAKDETVTVAGSLDLVPNSVDEAGRRMRTHVGADATDVSIAPLGGRDWAPVAATGLGTLFLVGGIAYYGPALRFGATKLLLFPLYARLKKEDILENPIRDDILDVVGATPGISASELGRRLSCGWGTLVYHLTVLERMQLLSSEREGRHKRFFVQGRINYSDKSAVGLLANPHARNVLHAIQENPGVVQKDVASQLGLTPSTVAWHVERLAAAGLVIKEEDGRLIRYYPSSRLGELLAQLGG